MVDFSRANIISQAQKLKNYGQALRNATRKESSVPQPQTQSGNQQTQTQQETYIYEYSGYDELGRSQKLNEQQYNSLMNKINSNSDKNVIFDVIPEEVANSQSNWWINSNNQYEWTPVTDSDKAHLEEINRYRRSSGLAERTTLISSAVKSEEYNQKWYSSGGGNRGLGSNRVHVKTKPDTANHTGEIQLADGSWVKQHKGNEKNVKILSVDQVQKNKNEYIQKQNEKTYHDWYEKNRASGTISNFEPLGKIGIIKDQATQKIGSVLEAVSAAGTKADSIINPITQKLPSWESIDKNKPVKNAFLSMTGMQPALTSHDFLSEKAEGHDNILSKIIVGSKDAREGVKDTIISEYEGLRTKPASKALEYGSYYAGGAVVGGVVKSTKIVSSPILKTISKPISKGASKLIESDGKITSLAGKKLSTAGKVIESGQVIDIGLGLGLAGEYGKSTFNAYQEAGIRGATSHTMEFGKGLMIGAPGFKKGDEFINNRFKKTETISEQNVERQFQVLEGVEQTKIETLGAPRIYTKLKTRIAGEGELNPTDLKNIDKDTRKFEINYRKTISKTDSNLNTGVEAAEGKGTMILNRNSVLNAEQKTLSGDTILKLDKKDWSVKFSEIGKNKFDMRKQYQIEQYGGKETPDYDFATTVESIRARPTNEIIPEKSKIELPEGSEQYFDVPKEPKHLELSTNFGQKPDSVPTVKHRTLNMFPSEKPGYFAYDKIRISKNNFKNTVRRLTSEEAGSLLPVREPKLIPGESRSNLDVWKKNTVLEEVQPKVTTTTRTIKTPYPEATRFELVVGSGINSILQNRGQTNIKNNTLQIPALNIRENFDLLNNQDVNIKNRVAVLQEVAVMQAQKQAQKQQLKTAFPEPYRTRNIVVIPVENKKTKSIIKLPDMGFPGLPAVSNTPINYGHRVKNHYVLDPASFVFGKRKR